MSVAFTMCWADRSDRARTDAPYRSYRSLMGEDDRPSVSLSPITPENWRACAGLEVGGSQQEFVAPVTYYLSLCAYDGGPWSPLAVQVKGEVVGFVMWAIDDEEGSFWIGGLVIDRRHQRRGYGRSVVEQLVGRAERERRQVALSYEAENVAARSLYRELGFVETGETVDGEIVARRPSAPPDR